MLDVKMNILLVSGMSGICHISVVDAKFAVSLFMMNVGRLQTAAC